MVDKLAESIGVKAYEVSSKTGEGINEAFEEIARDLIKFYSAERAKEKAKQLKLVEKNNKKRGCC